MTRVSTLRERLKQLSGDPIERVDALNDLSEAHHAIEPPALDKAMIFIEFRELRRPRGQALVRDAPR